eukprot:8591035-Pyramimonas_sp.AAC.2
MRVLAFKDTTEGRGGPCQLAQWTVAAKKVTPLGRVGPTRRTEKHSGLDIVLGHTRMSKRVASAEIEDPPPGLAGPRAADH